MVIIPICVFIVLLQMIFSLQPLYYLFFACRRTLVVPFCTYPPRICLSLCLYDSSLWSWLSPSAALQRVENTTIDSIHSSVEEHLGVFISSSRGTGNIYDCRPHSSGRKRRPQKLKLFSQVTQARLGTSLCSPPSPISPFKSLPFWMWALFPDPKQRTWPT